MPAEKYSRDDWLKAAFEALTVGGPDAVRIEPLARAIGITKGSFYWHFRDRAALLKALIDAWEERETQYLIENADRLGYPADDVLWSLLTDKLPDAAACRQQLAVRQWAKTDGNARFAVYTVDARRLAYLEQLFQDIGFSVEEAAARAALFDGLWLGEVLVERGEEDEERMRRLKRAFRLLTSKKVGGPVITV